MFQSGRRQCAGSLKLSLCNQDNNARALGNVHDLILEGCVNITDLGALGKVRKLVGIDLTQPDLLAMQELKNITSSTVGYLRIDGAAGLGVTRDEVTWISVSWTLPLTL